MSRWLGNRGRIENEEMMTVNDDDVLFCVRCVSESFWYPTTAEPLSCVVAVRSYK